VHLVGFTVEIYYDAQHYERQILANFTIEEFILWKMTVILFS